MHFGINVAVKIRLDNQENMLGEIVRKLLIICAILVIGLASNVRAIPIYGNATTNPTDIGVNETEAVPIPEPGTLILLGSGLLAAAAFSRKKFRK